jgi:hypothetical protein
MRKYVVRVYEPTLYFIEAETEQQAATEAVKRYKKENETWIQPDVQVAAIK